MSVNDTSIARVSVVLPTIGRPTLVRNCLESLARCTPRADEILVVDSSEDDSVARVVADFEAVGARLVLCPEFGLGSAFNLGLHEAKHELVLLTNDDCTVAPDWVGIGERSIARLPNGLVTGRVRPDGDPEIVPSTIDDPVRRDYVGELAFVLYTQCMALHRNEVLTFGGFDGGIRPSAEDNDLSYRWLRAGRTIRYEPDFIVWHHDWRTPEQLVRLYINYGVGQGMVYGKFVRERDPKILRFVIRDVRSVARGLASRMLRGRRPYGDWRIGLARGLPIGFVRGWRLPPGNT